jgi:hypothetical protein
MGDGGLLGIRRPGSINGPGAVCGIGQPHSVRLTNVGSPGIGPLRVEEGAKKFGNLSASKSNVAIFSFEVNGFKNIYISNG